MQSLVEIGQYRYQSEEEDENAKKFTHRKTDTSKLSVNKVNNFFIPNF